jgi:hypothetical protein
MNGARRLRIGIALHAWIVAAACDSAPPAVAGASDVTAGGDTCSAAALAAGTCGQTETKCEGLEAGKTGICGTVLDEAGKPLEGVMVQACTSEICDKVNTDAAGHFLVLVDPSERSMKAVGNKFQRVSPNWYQNAVSGQSNRVLKPVSMPAIGTPAPLPAVTGGTVTVAGGKLEITAPAGLTYTPGATEEVAGVALAIESLPPYDIEPWKGKEAASLAFVFYPFDWVKTAEGTDYAFKVMDVAGAKAGDVYDVYMSDPYNYGKLEKVGTATVGADGKTLASDAGIKLHILSTWVGVPR